MACPTPPAAAAPGRARGNVLLSGRPPGDLVRSRWPFQGIASRQINRASAPRRPIPPEIAVWDAWGTTSAALAACFIFLPVPSKGSPAPLATGLQGGARNWLKIQKAGEQWSGAFFCRHRCIRRNPYFPCARPLCFPLSPHWKKVWSRLPGPVEQRTAQGTRLDRFPQRAVPPPAPSTPLLCRAGRHPARLKRPCYTPPWCGFLN